MQDISVTLIILPRNDNIPWPYLVKCILIEKHPGNCNSCTKPLYTGRLFHYYMLGKSICHFRGVGSILSLLFYF